MPPDRGEPAQAPQAGQFLARPVGLTVSATALPLILVLGYGSLSVLIAEDIAISETRVGGGVAAFFVASALTSVPAGHVVERIGARIAMRLAALGCAVAMVLTGWLAQSWGMLIACLVIGGLANGLAQPAANLHLLQSVPHRRHGVAFGAKQAALPITGVLIGAAVPLVGVGLGWRWAYLIASVIALVLASVPTGGFKAVRRRAAAAPVAPTRDVQLVVMAVVGGIGSGTGNAMAAYLVLHAVSRDVEVGVAGLVLSLASVVSIATRFGLGVLADRQLRRAWRTMASLFGLGAMGLAGIAAAENVVVLAVSAGVAFGAGWGWPGLFHLAVARHRVHAPASTTGTAMVGVYVGAVVGPLLFAGILGATESYGIPWVTLAALALVAGGLGVWLDRTQSDRTLDFANTVY